MARNYIASVFSLFLCNKVIYSFNIETRNFIRHSGPPDSKFGFSLAYHKDTQGNWLLVGAPESETYVPGVRKGGAVFRCDVVVPNACEIIPFDTKGNHHDGTQFIDDKSDQWFGASISSRSGVVAACAPRYVWYSVKRNRREPIGGCFLLTNDRPPSRFKAYSPCMTNFWGYHRQGTCQAGFGVALSQGGNRLYVGAVGSWYWQGQVFYQNLLNMQEKLATAEGPKDLDMSYMGFSVAVGHFDHDSEEDVAVGVPRGDGLKGMVVLFDYQLRALYNISGDQIGSYFGYSVAVLDADGDKRDDIAIGAPWYSQKGQTIYEEGIVIVFRHTKQHNFRMASKLHGQKSRSHLGLSMASLKDLNGDGFQDLAVGAPGAGEVGRGGVYIFLGSPEGIIEKPSQVILAEHLSNQPIRTFGWSVMGGYDLDNNLYPDLAVGAHESSVAFIFKSRPVVEIEASVKIVSESGFFDLESLDCVLQDSTVVSCYPIRVCMAYKGKGVPAQIISVAESPTSPNLEPVLVPQEFGGKAAINYTFYFQNECGDDNICVPDLILTAKMREDRYILGSVKTLPIEFHVFNRGEDAYSTRLYVEIPNGIHFNKFLVTYNGSPNRLNPFCTKINNGQKQTGYEDEEEGIISRNLTKIVCELGNPLPAGGGVGMQLHLQPSLTISDLTPLVFELKVNSSSEEMERTIHDNRVTFVVPVQMKSDINIRGISWPDDEFTYNSSYFGESLLGANVPVTHEKFIGPEVTHIYDIINRGPSDLQNVQIYLLWPTRTLVGEPLLYLLATPSVTPKSINCSPVPDVNYLGLQVEEQPYDLSDEALSTIFQWNESDPLLVRFAREVTDDVYPTPLFSESVTDNDQEKGSDTIDDLLSCGSTNCTIMKCSTSTLRAGSNIFVEIKSRLWVDTIEKLGITDLKISSRLVVHSNVSLTDLKEASVTTWSDTVTSAVKTREVLPVTSQSWLIWLGSIVIGLLVLALLILILWLLGFFKRRRPHDESERELLNHRLAANGNCDQGR